MRKTASHGDADRTISARPTRHPPQRAEWHVPGGRTPLIRPRAMPRGPTGTQPRGLLRAVAAVLALLVGSALGVPLLAAPATAAAPAPAQGSQWYHAVLGLAQAQRIRQGAGVVVAVIDGGVDADHPKLRGQVLPGAGVGPEAAPDGRRDDDPDGHGTAMAGLIAGRNDNGPPEVRGIAPAARILPISTGAEAESTEVARGIHLAVDLGADIINLSLGSLGTATPDEREAVAYAFAHDVVVVASAGNAETGDRRPARSTPRRTSPASSPSPARPHGAASGAAHRWARGPSSPPRPRASGRPCRPGSPRTAWTPAPAPRTRPRSSPAWSRSSGRPAPTWTRPTSSIGSSPPRGTPDRRDATSSSVSASSTPARR